jgi:hypothetical protein
MTSTCLKLDLASTLSDIANKFRRALECSPQGWSLSNQCVHTTKLLAIYLRKEFPEMVSSVEWVQASADGSSSNQYGHSWLEVDGYVMDLTMDQFNIEMMGEFGHKVNINVPYLPVDVCLKEDSVQRKVFKSFIHNKIDKEFSILDRFDVIEHLYEIDRLKSYM